MVGLSILVAALVSLALPSFASAAKKRPDLATVAMQEPPDFAAPGDQIPLLLTLANEGNKAVGRTTFARIFLSNGRGPSARDRAISRRIRIPNLAPGQEHTVNVTARIPSDQEIRSYYFIGCADVGNLVRESDSLHNCRLSGQAVDLRARPVGPPGPTGPQGAAGANGQTGDVRRIARFDLDLGDAVSMAGTGDAEGSTQTRDFLTVGPLTFRALCRQTTNGDGGAPSDPFGASNNFDHDGDEAKILVFNSEGTMSFQGMVGPRSNIPAGEGTVDDDTEAGGEGKRMLIAAMQDPDPTTTFGAALGRGDPDATTDNEYRSGFRSGSAYVAHSGGTEVVIHMFAGIDVLGVGNEKCVFGGTAQVVQG